MKVKNQEKFSVLMSVYYKEEPKFLDLALSSILKEQTLIPNEVVLVEDGPLNKELYEVVDKYKKAYPNILKVYPLEKNGGLGPALNYGLSKCSNELIARMDSDDFSAPDRCEKLLNIFKEDYSYDCVGSFEVEFENDLDDVVAIHKVPETSDEIDKFMLRRCALLHPTVMYKKSAVLAAGNYRNVLLYEDYDLFMRMVCENHCKCYNIQENLYFIRINANFFKRRGGFKYMKTAIKFKNMQRKKGYMSFKDFIISAGGQAFVCLMPNKMRRWFYLKFLR